MGKEEVVKKVYKQGKSKANEEKESIKREVEMIDGFVNVFRRFMKRSSHCFFQVLVCFAFNPIFAIVSLSLVLFAFLPQSNPHWNFLIVCNLSFPDDISQSSTL
jgi:hypothetical protein